MSFVSELPLEDPFFVGVVNLIKSVGFQADPNLGIIQLKVCEDFLLDSEFVSEHERMALGMITSIIKQLLYTIHTQGLVVGTFILNDTGNDVEGFWDCFDSIFSDMAGQNLGVLADTYNAGSMVVAWIGLPYTLATGVGDAISSSVADCW